MALPQIIVQFCHHLIIVFTGYLHFLPSDTEVKSPHSILGFTSKDILAGQLHRNEIEVTLVGKISKLTREQQAAVITFWNQTGLDYQHCFQCPHNLENM